MGCLKEVLLEKDLAGIVFGVEITYVDASSLHCGACIKASNRHKISVHRVLHAVFEGQLRRFTMWKNIPLLQADHSADKLPAVEQQGCHLLEIG